MNKEEFRKVVQDEIDKKHKDIEWWFARFKETENPNHLRMCGEAKGFIDGVGWILEKSQEVDFI